MAPLIDGTKYPVSLRDGDICIHVDVNTGVCGVAVIPDWKELNGSALCCESTVD